MPHPNILLCTLNARYIHASLGLRYLLANLGELRGQATLLEFTIKRPVSEIVDHILAQLPASKGAISPIVGFGVYIWNVEETQRVLLALRPLRPDVYVVLGGPEVSHETQAQSITALADFVITGWGDLSFAKLCHDLLAGKPPKEKILTGAQPALAQITLPYEEYSDSDLAHRVLYVEASRGCPFRCAFCLSALDKTAWSFAPDRFLDALDRLYRRGARQFKFVDRTFNLDIDHTLRILDFFLSKMGEQGPTEPSLFLHFELIPDHLPERLRDKIRQFPPGTLQLEIGIQTFNPSVQANIARRQNEEKSLANLTWLRQETQAHLHTDLIFGLPGETLASFATGFDRLYRLEPHEIQLGLLKRLRGTPITELAERFGLCFSPAPPYTVTETGHVDAATIARFQRMTGYWDRIANSGRFPRTLHYLLDAPSPFYAFLTLSDWLAEYSASTQVCTPEFLVDALYAYQQQRGETDTIRQHLLGDYLSSGARSRPECLKPDLGYQPPRPKSAQPGSLSQRQQRHLPT